MNALSILILALVLGLMILALRSLRRNKGKSPCAGCSQSENCAACKLKQREKL